jgi:SAM-dependent methyltransferase
MSKYGGTFWDERYSDKDYVYGTTPNEFFKEQIDLLKPGRILMIGEGEGRNGVYAAQKGWLVDAVDFSLKAKEKALNHAKDKNVKINYTVDNLENYNPQKNFYDAAALIFVHLNENIRTDIHKKVMDSLKPEGIVIMEAYSKEQMGRTSGGPQNPEMLYSIENVKETFTGLTPVILSKGIVYLTESALHSGEASVIRFIGKKEPK